MVISTGHTTDRMDVCPQFEPESGGQGTCAGRGGAAAAAVVPPGVVGFGVCEMAFVHESDRRFQATFESSSMRNTDFNGHV